MSLKPETLTPDTITKLQTLIQADPALIAQLQSCTDAATSAAVIAKAAAAKGIEVTSPELLEHFEATTAKQGVMSDAELELVAGGGTFGAVLYSMSTFGIGCIVASALESKTPNPDCNKMLASLLPI